MVIRVTFVRFNSAQQGSCYFGKLNLKMELTSPILSAVGRPSAAYRLGTYFVYFTSLLVYDSAILPLLRALAAGPRVSVLGLRRNSLKSTKYFPKK